MLLHSLYSSLYFNPSSFLSVVVLVRCLLILIDIYDRLIAYLTIIQTRPHILIKGSIGCVNDRSGLDSVVTGGRVVRVRCVASRNSSLSIYLLLPVPFLQGMEVLQKNARTGRVLCYHYIEKNFLTTGTDLILVVFKKAIMFNLN